MLKAAKVSKSGYYKWKKRSIISTADTISSRIIFIYNKYHGIYGYRRIKVAYEKLYAEVINHKKVYRIMQNAGLQAIIRKRRKNFYKFSPILKPNVLNQDFEAKRENTKWTTDITHLNYNNGILYLSVILDLYNREILSYELSSKKDIQLVIITLNKAVSTVKNTAGIILHSDQGSQYTTEYYSNLLRSYGIIHSMSRRGNCLDNAPVECFFSHLKSEAIYTKKFVSKEQIIKAVEHYIRFYNNERFQIKLKNLSPVSYRIQENINSTI